MQQMTRVSDGLSVLQKRFVDSPVQAEAAGHIVQFYESDNFLIKSLYEFVSTGLLAGERSIVIATPQHLDYLEEAMLANGINPAAESERGSYLAINAEAFLAQIVNGSQLDDEVCEQHLKRLLTEVKGKIVRVFGELVALLWSRGQPDAALQLENVWNRLGRAYSFALCCAYPLHSFNKAGDGGHVGRISRSHTQTIPGESFNIVGGNEELRRAVVLLQQKAGAASSAALGRESAEKALRASEIERDHLARLNAAKDEFISLASHQLRTPATVVKLYIGMLLDGFEGKLPAGLRKSLQKAYESNERQIKLVNELLLVARVDAGKVRLAKESFNLARLIRSVAAELRPTIEKRRQRLTVRMPRCVNIVADRHYLRMVLENLLENASKYSPEGNPIGITLESRDEGIAIQVVDKGIGIADEDIPRLYQKFSRVYTPFSSGVEGTGLGLYWSKKIIELHRGKLSLLSRPNKGSTFTISLPA